MHNMHNAEWGSLIAQCKILIEEKTANMKFGDSQWLKHLKEFNQLSKKKPTKRAIDDLRVLVIKLSS